MKRPSLTLRVSRRAVAAVVLVDEQLEFFDGRHLRSQRDAALRGGVRYVDLLIRLTKPSSVVVDCATNEGSTTEALLADVLSLLGDRGLMPRRLAIADVLHAYGVPGPASRTELRQIAAPLFADLEGFQRKVRPYVLDAAAVALYAETQTALGGQL